MLQIDEARIPPLPVARSLDERRHGLREVARSAHHQRDLGRERLLCAGVELAWSAATAGSGLAAGFGVLLGLRAASASEKWNFSKSRVGIQVRYATLTKSSSCHGFRV